jgi:phosphate/sulfate permease
MTAVMMFSLGVLILLALLDLWVGVVNDAVNFLNSAIGSRVVTRQVVLVVASVGVIFGALSAGGMMEVARKGVFNPHQFTDGSGGLLLGAILAVYFGVMVADVLMLDLYNTFGLPTSTTVSIVSEMVGASIGVSFWMHHGNLGDALSVINTGPVLAIYSGIFLSVFIAFCVGALLMLVVRLLYSHAPARSFAALGWLWTGASFSALVTFVLVKGLKNTAILGDELTALIKSNMLVVAGGAFVIAAIVGVVLRHRPRLVLGAVIVTGTGTLAMAFASNDLVNFIGPTVAAVQAAMLGDAYLSGQVPTQGWMLLVAGVVMVASLWSSRKARRVTDTEVRLAAHGETRQRFESNRFSRSLVQWAMALWRTVKRPVPSATKLWADRRTAPPPPEPGQPPYDLLRASVNLVVASVLISIGTANKLPLSTTYITFMTAMGASLADRHWSLETADRRIAGILTVIGGWLLTGVLAATAAFITASIAYVGQAWGVGLLAICVLMALARTARVKLAGFDSDGA